MAKRKMAEMENEMADQPKCVDLTSKSNTKWDRKGKFCTIQRINEEQGMGEEEDDLGRRCNCDIKVADQPKVQPFGEGVSDLISKIRSIPEDRAKVKEFFLYELLIIATRALSKVRLESLVDEGIHGAQPELFIDIVPDLKNCSLTIMDTGIGMTEDELVRYLCNIQEDARRAATRPDFDLSRCYSNDQEFSLGFHSAYMVADKVELTTKTTGGLHQYKWVSDGRDSFTISRGDTTPGDTTLDRRGTKVTLFLKEEHGKYLDERVLTDLVKKNMKMLRYPIYIVVDDDGVKTRKEIVDDEKEKRKKEELPFEELKEKFEGLRQLFKKVLGSRVKDVVVCDGMDEVASRLSRDMTTFEINPRSMIMEALRQKAEAMAEDKDTAHGKEKEEEKEEEEEEDSGEERDDEDLVTQLLKEEEEEEEDEEEEEVNLEDLILEQFEGCMDNIWLYDMRHGTSYLKNPALNRALGRLDFLG